MMSFFWAVSDTRAVYTLLVKSGELSFMSVTLTLSIRDVQRAGSPESHASITNVCVLL